MTRILIGKRRALPDCCPVCGEGQQGEVKTMSDLLRSFYGEWHAEMDLVWGSYPQWYGVCGNCNIRSQINTSMENTLMGRLGKQASWSGGTYTIPFKP